MTTYAQLVADHQEYLEGQRQHAIDAGAPMYLVWSRKRAAWWGPNCRGYTTDRTQAGRYTEAEAREIERQSSYGPEHLRSVAVEDVPGQEVAA
jgi:hypothetical protein